MAETASGGCDEGASASVLPTKLLGRRWAYHNELEHQLLESCGKQVRSRHPTNPSARIAAPRVLPNECNERCSMFSPVTTTSEIGIGCLNRLDDCTRTLVVSGFGREKRLLNEPVVSAKTDDGQHPRDGKLAAKMVGSKHPIKSNGEKSTFTRPPSWSFGESGIGERYGHRVRPSSTGTPRRAYAKDLLPPRDLELFHPIGVKPSAIRPRTAVET
mmetsp:Transcript_71088/g.197478  ORF Transcript_71088/g.197478 Transcript_71088/m.197478 type:complete len:215 (-) Transcript_71088:91-735(-)|eukprot:CAMPEP_0117528948 /NCGR_PEP_ID=MMETSP0784-20121206/37581_1 /TAXON_ID=39447 /ORGANISM="" /LENGTH=214 /DNA_ID=CAMNT_0005325257 /DNA_START=161 /DNA_END=805 /DNA_ORIENTATION=+